MKKLRGHATPCPGPEWKPARFLVSLFQDVETVQGFEYRGLGFWLQSTSIAKYRRKDGSRKVYINYCLTHLNTGHRVHSFYEIADEVAFAAATDFAEMVDWSFDGLDGWKNYCPDMLEKRKDWLAKHGLTFEAGAGPYPETALVVAMARAG